MRQLRLPSATLASLISPFLSKTFNLAEISNIIKIADRAEFILNIYYEHHFEESSVTLKIKLRMKFGKSLVSHESILFVFFYY
jgi:hypothetical protein